MATTGTGSAQLTAVPPQPRSPAPTAPASTATLIGSVQRAVRLLETVAGHDYGAPAKQLARETGLALPTTYHLLRTLVHEGYLRRDKGLFFLGEAAERLMRAVEKVTADPNLHTPDLGGPANTRQVTDAVLEALRADNL